MRIPIYNDLLNTFNYASIGKNGKSKTKYRRSNHNIPRMHNSYYVLYCRITIVTQKMNEFKQAESNFKCTFNQKNKNLVSLHYILQFTSTADALNKRKQQMGVLQLSCNRKICGMEIRHHNKKICKSNK